MRKRIFWAFFAICLTCVLLAFGASILLFANYYDRQAILKLKQGSHHLAIGLKKYGIDYVLNLNTEYHISIIDRFGNVIYDNAEKPGQLGNQKAEKEFKDGMQYGIGQSLRPSSSTKQMLYYAVKIFLDKDSIHSKNHTENIAATNTIINEKQPYILRVALWHDFSSFLPYICIGLIACLATSYALSSKISSYIITPLNSLSLENPAMLKKYKELYPIFQKIDEQNNLIQKQIRRLKAKQEEFSTITQNMKDGFLLLDSKGNILSFNKSSMRLFGALSEGMNIAMFMQHETLFELILSWQRHGEWSGEQKFTKTIECDGCSYQVIAESVFEPESDLPENLDNDSKPSRLIGFAIIILDITEKAQREHLRREFSANVSHELKTPLTSILGVTEMLKNNLIKQDDIPKFLDNINTEAKHLMNLIEDIIILNELDNDYTLMPCRLSVQNLCHTAITMLEDSIKQKEIFYEILGSDFMVIGEQRLLTILLFQLCENAVKYNKKQGNIKIIMNADKKSLCIKDSGIGVPAMYHDRIFERFFCVDKSHSNMINGTGLGLSIVKHIANLHHATIELESVLQVGTSITISFR